MERERKRERERLVAMSIMALGKLKLSIRTHSILTFSISIFETKMLSLNEQRRMI